MLGNVSKVGWPNASCCSLDWNARPLVRKGVAAWGFLAIGAFPVCRNCTGREGSKTYLFNAGLHQSLTTHADTPYHPIQNRLRHTGGDMPRGRPSYRAQRKAIQAMRYEQMCHAALAARRAHHARESAGNSARVVVSPSAIPPKLVSAWGLPSFWRWSCRSDKLPASPLTTHVIERCCPM